MALGVISYLETFPEIRAVAFQGNDPAQGSEIITWERKNSPFKLPADVKAFYSMFNGFNLSWSVEIGEKTETIGEMRINKLDNVVKNATEFFVQEYLPEDVPPPNPKLCTMFVIDSSCSLGEVVLLYRNSNSGATSSLQLSPGSSGNASSAPEEPEVWLLDHSAQLTFLCKSFTNYMRLMVTHLGIHGWQSVFFDVGWCLSTQHWMQMFCKERLIVDRHYRSEVAADKRIMT
eukprot:gene36532-44318_t